MRGKTITWTLVALFIVSLAISSMPISYAGEEEGYPIVSVTPYESGPKNPGQSFSVNIVVDYVEGLNAFQFKLSWNQKILKLSTANPAVEGPFLKTGGPTYFVYAPGIAGESITIANMITTQDWADGGGALATVNLEVIGGGETDLELTGKFLDVDSFEIYTEWVKGHFYSPFPYIDFKWFVPTAVELSPEDSVNVTGNTFIRLVDPEGDPYYIVGDTYWRMTRTLNLTEDTGAPEQVDIVEGGTMFYGDEIIFDASESYDLNSTGHRVPLDPTGFKWVIRDGGVDTFTSKGTTYDTKYESGVELPYGDTFSYTFPGDLPDVYKLYSYLLGFHDLELKVTDSDNNTARYYTWIRIYRLAPAKLSMVHIPNPKHSLSKDGYTITFEGKVQNRAGCGEFPYDFLAVYLELARMIHANIWIRMQFDIEDSAGNPVPNGTVYSDALWLQMTEMNVNPLKATWTMPSNIQRGTYYVKTTAWFCGSGVTYGLEAAGTQLDSFKIVS